MDIFGSIKKAVKVFYDDVNTPDSFKIGEAFEEYTRNVIFPKDFYKMIHKTPSYTSNKNDFSEESLKPDYLFEDIKTKKQFHIECKYRSKNERDENAILEICKDYQYKRYSEINKNTPVFILLGFTEKPENENISIKELRNIYGSLAEAFIDVDIFLIPLSTLSSNIFDMNNCIHYAISNSLPLSNKLLWNYFSNYELFHGYCIRCKKRIPELISNPLCGNCFGEWNKYKNYSYKEKYCHSCGKDHDSSMSRPYCKTCYYS